MFATEILIDKITMHVNEIQKCAVNIIRDHFGNDTKIYLFGSWAKGNARENSDIDIAVDAHKNKKIMREKFLLIRQEIDDIPTLRKIDIIDLSLATDKFKNHIFKHAILL